MAKSIYKDEKSLKDIDTILELATKSLEKDNVVLPDINILTPLIGTSIKASIGSGVIGAAAASTVFLPITAPITILGGIGYLFFKNKKDKELYNKKLLRYNEAIKKQNATIKKYQEKDRERVKTENELGKENCELREKTKELLALNEALLKIIENLGSDLQAA